MAKKDVVRNPKAMHVAGDNDSVLTIAGFEGAFKKDFPSIPRKSVSVDTCAIRQGRRNADENFNVKLDNCCDASHMTRIKSRMAEFVLLFFTHDRRSTRKKNQKKKGRERKFITSARFEQ